MSSQCARCGKPLPAIESDSETFIEGESLCADCRERTAPTGSLEMSDGRATETWHKSRGSEDRVAHFALVRVLGSGSFGDVWLADDLRLGRAVALKLPGGKSPDASTLLHEAKTAASLRHPNIVTVFEVGEEKGQIYIASELIDGITLRDFLSIGRPPLGRVIEILVPIAEALQYAHEHRIVHRDVKPANILLDHAGKPYVNDFGLAKRLSADETISSEGQVVGTARYMSPEQAYGKTEETDARSDIYAVGVMMFEMLTRESPFRGNARAILQQKVTQDAPSPRMLEPSIPRDLETICLKCLEREPSNRFESAKDLVDELKRFTAGEPIRSRPIGRIERGWRWCKRRPAIASLALALALSLTVGLASTTFYGFQSAANAYSAKQKLYRSWMNLIATQSMDGNPAGVRDLLSKISADPELAEMSGFEFDYFDNQVSQITPLGTRGGAVLDVAITDDESMSAATVGDRDFGGREITVWDTASGRLIRELRAGERGFTAIDFSKANNQLVAGAKDGYLHFYEPGKGESEVNKLFHGPPVAFAAFSPDGRFVIASGVKRAVRMWDTESNQLIAQIPTGQGETRAIRFTPDSSYLYIADDDGRIRKWSVSGLVATGPDAVPVPEALFNTLPNPVAMCISDSGDELIVGFFNTSVMVLNLRDKPLPSQTNLFLQNWGLIQDMVPVPSSPLVALTTSSGNLYLVDKNTGREIRAISSHATPGFLAMSGNGKVLLLGSGDGTVSKLDPQSLAKPEVVWSESPVRAARFLNPTKVLAAYENADMTLWDLSSSKKISTIDHSAKTMLIAVNPKYNLVATAGSAEGMEIRDLTSLATQKTLSTSRAGVSAMQFSRSGNLLAVAIRGGPIRLYTTGDWEQPQMEISADEQLVSSVAISHDDSLLAVARSGNAVDLRRTLDGELVETISFDHDAPNVIEFCQDKTTLAIGSNGGTITLYDLPSRRIRIATKGHTGRINAIAVIPNSHTIVSAGMDRRVKLWDLQSGELITQLVNHFRQVFTLAVSEDGKTIVSGGLEGDLRVW